MGGAMTAAALGMASNLTPIALKLGGALMSVYLMFELIQFWAGRNPSIVQVLFDVTIPAIIAALLINDYASKIGMLENMLDVFRNVGGTTNSLDNVFNMYKSVMAGVGKAFWGVLGNHGNFLDMIVHPGQAAAAVIDALACILFLLMILYFVATGAAEVFGLLLLGPFLHAVGVAFGPLLLCGLITPWTINYFKTWIGFLVISAGLTGVLNVILTIAATMISSVGLDVAATGGEYGSAVSLMITTLLLMTVNSMISQAPGITSALLPGQIGARATGAAQTQAAMRSAGAQKQGVKNTMKSAGGIYKGAMNKLKGGGKGGATPAPKPAGTP